MIKLIFIAIIALSSNINTVYAGFNISASALYTDINDPKYPYRDNYEPKVQGISLGYSYNIEGFDISISTNRLFNKVTRRAVDCNGKECVSISEIAYDSLQIGYLINRFIPAIFIANTTLNKALYYKDRIIGRASNNFIAYGFGGTYIINKQLSTSLNMIMPNQEVYLKKGVSLSINYHF